MTTKPYKFNEEENNSSRVSEPVTAYGKTPKTKEIADTNKELLLDEGLHKLAGIWRNDPEADKIYEAIQNGRQSGITRHIIPFDK